MKICVSSYSFHKYTTEGKLDQLTLMDKAKELGFEGVEFSYDKASIEANVPKIVERSRDLDLPVVCYLTGADFVNRDFEKEVARLHEEVDIAAALGVKLMRHDTTYSFPKGMTFDDILPIIAEGCRRVTEYAQTKGVRTMVENHGLMVQDSARVTALYHAVNHENFSLLTDMGNFMCADEKPVESVKIAAPMAVHAHAKDFFHKEKGEYVPNGQGWFGTRGGNALRGTIIGHGAVNVPECLKTLRAAGYDGWLSVEFEGIEDCITSLEADLKNLKEMLA